MTRACHKLDSGWRLCLLSCAFNLILFLCCSLIAMRHCKRVTTEGDNNNNASLWLLLSQYCLPSSCAVSALFKIQTFCLDIPDAFIEVLIKFWSIFCVSFLLLEEALSWPARKTKFIVARKLKRERNIYSYWNENTVLWVHWLLYLKI